VTLCFKIVWCYGENNAQHYLKNVPGDAERCSHHDAKGVPEFENSQNVPKLIVMDDLMVILIWF